MAALSAELLDALPTPVARLLLRATRTRDSKLRHDHALAAWEVTFRLIVASHPPEDLTPLREPSMGHWRQALHLPKRRTSRTPELLKAVAFFWQHAGQNAATPREVSAQTLVEPLPVYRNRCSTAHTTPRSESFYREASEHLTLSLAIAWHEHMFWPASAQLVFLSHIELDAHGQRHARVLLLHGGIPQVLDENTVVDEHLLPGRVYLHDGDQFTSLFPWVLCHQIAEQEERFYLFQSSHRGVTFLDCDLGEPVSQEQLAARGLPVHDPLTPPAQGAQMTPLPPTVQPADAPYRLLPARRSLPSLVSTSPDGRRWAWLSGMLVALGALAAGGFRLTTGLAWSDLTFRDREQGLGWLERARGHLATGSPRAALAAGRRGLAAAHGQPAHEHELLQLLATVTEQQGDAEQARTLLLRAWELRQTDTLEQRLEDLCARAPALEDPYRQAKVVRGSAPVVLHADASEATLGPTLDPGRCVRVALPSFRYQGERAEVWYQAAVRRGGVTERGWLRGQDIAPGDQAVIWLRRAQIAQQAGILADQLAASSAGLNALRTSPDDRAKLFLVQAQTHLQRGADALALESFIDGYKADSPKAREATSEGIEKLCARLGPPRLEGDERRYKVVSWAKDTRTGNLREEPSMGATRVIELPRPTCVLAGPAKTVSPGQVWFPVETFFQGEKRQGWMHQVVLSP